MLSEVDLSPTALKADLPYPLSEQDAYVCCHPAIMKLSFTINLSYAITNTSTLDGLEYSRPPGLPEPIGLEL